jgi:hypothetical protein
MNGSDKTKLAALAGVCLSTVYNLFWGMRLRPRTYLEIELAAKKLGLAKQLPKNGKKRRAQKIGAEPCGQAVGEPHAS